MKTYLGGGDIGEWSASRTVRFTPGEKSPSTHWIGGSVGPTAGLDAVEKRKIPSIRRQSNPRAPIVQPITSRYTELPRLFYTDKYAPNREMCTRTIKIF